MTTEELKEHQEVIERCISEKKIDSYMSNYSATSKRFNINFFTADKLIDITSKSGKECRITTCTSRGKNKQLKQFKNMQIIKDKGEYLKIFNTANKYCSEKNLSKVITLYRIITNV